MNRFGHVVREREGGGRRGVQREREREKRDLLTGNTLVTLYPRYTGQAKSTLTVYPRDTLGYPGQF